MQFKRITELEWDFEETTKELDAKFNEQLFQDSKINEVGKNIEKAHKNKIEFEK